MSIVRNNFSQNEIEDLAIQIYKSINEETNLAYRSVDELQKLMKNGYIFVDFEDENIISFIICEKVWRDYYELGAWNVIDKYKKQGIATHVLESAMNSKNKYVFFTFQQRVIEIFKKKYGFKITKLFKIHPILALLLIKKRITFKRIKSIFAHASKEKAYLMIQTND